MEWLANISVRWVLVAVGVLVLLTTLLRLPRSRSGALAWIEEHAQIVLSVVVVVFLVIRPFLFQAFYIPSGSMEPTLQGPPRHPMGDRLLVNKLIYLLSNPRRGDIVVFKAPPEVEITEKEYIKRVIGLPGETVEVVPPRLLADGTEAIVLSDEGSYFGSEPGLELDRYPPEIAPDGSSATLTPVARQPIRVVASRGPVRQTPYRVEVDGRVLLEDPSGRIGSAGGLEMYGGPPGMGAVYTLDEEPRLIVIRARRLTFEDGHVRINGQPLAEPYIAEAPRYRMRPRKLGPREYLMLGDNRNESNDSHEWGPLTRDRMIGRAEIVFWPPGRFRLFDWWLLVAIAALFFGYEGLAYLFRRRAAALR